MSPRGAAPARAAGFTLIEIVVALALAGLVALLLLEGVRFASGAFERLSLRAEAIDRRRLVAEILVRELSPALADPAFGAAGNFQGGPGRMSFLSLAEESGPGLYRAGLLLDDSLPERPLVLTRQLADPGRPTSVRRTVLAPTARSARFAYYGPAEAGGDAVWLDRWEGRRDPPRLVRLTLDGSDDAGTPPVIVRLWGAPR